MLYFEFYLTRPRIQYFFEKLIHYVFVNIPGFLICLGTEDKAMNTIIHDM